jgi:AraC-like DNA-binding protein
VATEGITISHVDDAADLPGHRLRKLSNDRLGCYNFTAFINHRRISSAQAILIDPAAARRTVASLDFDLGFGSPGPFSRAVREATGSTPTGYRKHALSRPAPIPDRL